MELLSPAGHWEAMVAAVQSGADSVYFGCGGFNARRGAKNFTPEELSPAVAYCHLRGVKVYLTVNTLVTDRELAAAGDLLRQASRAGVDAVIVQDWGLAALAREIVPDLPLHGSTQMTVHSLAGVEAAARLGMGCVVLSREVSREDMAHICRNSPIKIEVFAHGALCMCYSGQCAMSALIGGRSGNRGACAQPCRLPYRLDEGKAGHPLSLKDACLVSHLRELRDMGVSILKLEGRMKRPEYVAVVTEIYARLLREDRLPTGEELRELEQAFSRQGFTDGYWRGRPGPGMFGVRPEGERAPEELFQAARAAYSREDRRTVPVAMEAAVLAGAPARLTVTDGEGRSAAAQGPVPEAARTRPLTAGDLEARLAKTGGTVFRPGRVRVQVEEGLSLPASAVNALRREALDRLAELRQAPPSRREADPAPLPPAEAAAAPAPRLCPYCRMEIADDATRCPHCTSKLAGPVPGGGVPAGGADWGILSITLREPGRGVLRSPPPDLHGPRGGGFDRPAGGGRGPGLRLRRPGDPGPGGPGPGGGVHRPPGGFRAEPVQQPVSAGGEVLGPSQRGGVL